MQNINTSIPADEIDLLEILTTLWAFKFYIIFSCMVGISFGAYKAMTAQKTYSANANYQIFSKSSGGLNLGNNTSSFSLAAVTGGLKDENLAPIDQVMGRQFIESLDKIVNLHDDKFFNPDDIIDVSWKSKIIKLIKKLIGWENSNIINAEEESWQRIISKYRSNISLSETPGGSVKVHVIHSNPDRSAKVANAIMIKIINDSKAKENLVQKNQINYLSTTLSKSMEELEISNEKLKQFTLLYGAIPLDGFNIVAQQLNLVREDLMLTKKLHNAIADLSSLLKSGKASDADYKTLQNKHPIVDEVSFRRVLGQNEIITIWSWPELTSTMAVLSTLSDRLAYLELQADNLQTEAVKLSNSVETFAKLKRNQEVAEANYTVLIEQVKTQETIAGFRPETSEIFEYAVAPLYPSEPKRNKLILINGIFGLSLGCILMYLYSLSYGAYYSSRSIIFASKARLAVNAKALAFIRRKSISKIIKKIPNKSQTVLRNIAVEIHQSGNFFVALTSSNSKLKSINLAYAIASYMQSKDMKIAIINFSAGQKDIAHESDKLTIGSFSISEEVERISVLRPINNLKPIDALGEKDFHMQIELLKSKFSYIFLCANNTDTVSLASALKGLDVHHIAVARINKTKLKPFKQLIKILPIQGLLYE
jgi:polysaccharide biosynthesis transport protein